MNARRHHFIGLARRLLLAGMLALAPATGWAQTAGLWIGRAAVNAVSYPADSTASETPVPTDNEALLRLIIHVDSTGQARILQRAIQSIEDNEVLLYPDESLVDRDLSSDIRRVSSVGFPVMLPLRSAGGNFNAPSDPLVFEIAVGYDDPTNPFKHAYHPDHNNLDSRYEDPLSEGSESFTVDRKLTLFFSGEDDPPAEVADDPDWGSTLVGGTYQERITGLYRQVINDVTIEDIVVEGTFLLRHVSDVDTLTDLGELIPDERFSTYTDGLTAYYTFDEGFGFTTTENVYDLTTELVSVYEEDSWADGPVGLGSAIVFDQTDGHADLGDSFRLQSTGNQTIELWIYAAGGLEDDTETTEDESVRTRQAVLGKALDGEFTLLLEDDLSLTYTYGTTGTNTEEGTWESFNTGSFMLAEDTWTHVVVVRDFDEGVLQWYFDGNAILSDTLGLTSAAASEEPALLGVGVLGDPFVGAIDELRIWNLARTQGEILATMELTIEDATDYAPVTGYPDGLVAYYPMEEGSGAVLSDVINGNDGELTNMDTAAAWVDGAVGGALLLDGTDDYVYLGNPSDLQQDGDLTIEAWIRLDAAATTSRSHIILGKAYGGEYYSQITGTARVMMGYGMAGTNGGSYGERTWMYTGLDSVTFGEWTHVAIVRDFTNEEWTVYLNGEAVGTTINHTTVRASAGSEVAAIGASRRSSGTALYYFDGEIDELRVWNTARSETEIRANMNTAIEPLE